MARRRKRARRGRLLLLAGGLVALAAATSDDDEPQRTNDDDDEPQRTSEPQRTTSQTARPGTVVFEAEIIMDYRPEPASYGEVGSEVCLPAFMGGGCRTVPIALGYPESWVPAGRQTATLAEFGFVPDLRVWIEADAATELETGKLPSQWTPCHRWVFVGQTADGPLVYDRGASDVIGDDVERCRFAVPEERPNVGIAREGDVYRLGFSPTPGEGGAARYRILIEVRKP